ncbi:hypothetical protein HQ520_05735, partial [bacterium]|nr:hypothetical protein [bacterium]
MWNAPERMGRVAAIAPGAPQPVPNQIFTPEYLNKIRSGTNETEKAEARRVADPLLTISDEAWREMIPDYSPYPSFGLLFVCPFCGRKLGQQDPHNRNRFDIAQPHEAARPCCDTVMYEDTGDAPADYPYKADRVLKVAHMDGTVHDYPYWEGKNRLGDPSVLFARSAVWKTRLDYIHFTALPALANAWLKTGDERYARKALAIFHRLAEVYPAWPLWEYPKTNETYSWYRDQIDGRYDTPKKGGLAMGTDGKPLTREAFDALPRPNRFSEPSWGDANRFGTHGMGFFLGKLGWYYLAVKASPAAKTYSKEAFGDPDRLEAFIESRLFNELAKEFSSGRPMLGNYAQATMGEAVYIGVAANDPYLYNLGLEIADSLTLNHEYPDVSFQEGSILYNGQMSGTHNIVRDMLGGASDERERVFPFTKFARENMYRVFEGMSTWRGVQSGHGDGNDGEWVVGRVYGTRYGNPKADWAQWKEQPYDPSDPTRPISRFLPNYGFAVLASGAPGHRLESLFLFDKNVGHTHQGNLNLQLAWEGSLIAPELGYCAFWRTLDVSERNPMHDAIYAVPWRYRLLDNAEPKDGFNGVLEHENVWSLSHCGVFQNTVLVNERAGRHRGHTKTGYSQPVTLSAPPGSGGVGSILQVAEAEDATSWPTAGVDVTLYRRAVVNVERPDGRAYVADLFRVRGGERQCYEFKMPRAEIVRTDLSAGKEVGNGEAYLESIPGVKEWQTDAPEWSGNHADLGFRYLNDMTVYPAPESWWVRWLWDPRIRLDEAAGFPNVVVDMRGVEIPGPQQETRDEVWLSRSDYPLRLNEMIGEKRFQSAVVFEKGVSVYSRFRQGQPGLMTRFAHLFEMHEEGTSSTVMQAKYWPLAPSSVLDPSDRDDYGLALEVGFDDGGRDWLVSAPDAEGRHVEGAPEDLETAARFALVRTDRDGSFLEGALV